MSQNKPDKLNPGTPRTNLSQVNRTGAQRTTNLEEAMDVDPNSTVANDGHPDNVRSTDAVQPERLHAWFNVSSEPHNPPGSLDTPSEHTDDVMEPIDEKDEASATGVVEARFEDVLRYRTLVTQTDTRICKGCTMIRCLPWKILVIFHPPESGSMGFFVQCNAESESQTWSCSAKATLVLVAQRPGCKNKEMKIQHTFTHKENDWGFQSFISYDDLFNPDRGFIGVDDGMDSILLRAHVKADAPHGADWDSKRHTGFVGLKNQGATCYLNSLLQALYCTNKLRRAVFLMPTDSDDAQTSVPLALQRVFYELQTSSRAVGTKKLTRSFGWATLDSFMQHDAQELCRVLLDNLENKMKGTSVEDVIPGLFCGKMLSYIRCINVPYESKREEDFYDIQLKVNGNHNIYDAFNEYVAKEMLSQDNKYDADKYGLQEAEKGVVFIRFPPVLYLQLMRFQYDFVADTNVKINDRFEFHYSLKLDRFLLHPDPQSPATYFLHAVLVHSGDNHGGHYVVYINPAGNGVWYQFDDDVVSRCSLRDAIDMNFGGTDDPDMRPCTNAYMLVYIAESAKEDVLKPVPISDIPETLRERFIEEQRLEEAKRLDKERSHLYMDIYLLLEEDFYGWQGPELCNADLLPNRLLRVSKQSNRAELVAAVAKELNYPPEDVRLWHFRPRRKNIPSYLIELDDNPLQYAPKDKHIFFAQCPLCPSSIPSSSPRPATSPGLDREQITADKRLFFLKYFDPVSWTMTFCGHVELPADEPLSALEPELRERAGLPHGCSFILYQDDPKTVVSEISQPKTPVSKLFKREHQGQLIYFQAKSYYSCLMSSSLACLGPAELGKEALCSLNEDANSNTTLTTGNVAAEHKLTHGGPTENINGLPPNSSPKDDYRDDSDVGTRIIENNLPPAVDPLRLHRMATMSNTDGIKSSSSISPSAVPGQQMSPMLHTQPVIPAVDIQPINKYYSGYLNQVEILLVDKMRPSDPGILIRVAADLTYWEFANVAAAYLSTQSDRLQFFRSQSVGAGVGSVTAPISVSPLSGATTGIVGSDLNTSPVGSDLGVGVQGCNTNLSVDNPSPGAAVAIDPSLNPQAVAARASGFLQNSPYANNLLALAAAQGLAQEPPSAAIPSTHTGSMRDFFFPFTTSPNNSSWASDAGGIGGGLGSGGASLAAAAAAASTTPDRFPSPLNRYCGLKTMNRSPFGPVTFPPPRRVYYAHLAIGIDELETMRQMRVAFVGPKLSVKAELLLSVPQNGLVIDLLKEASRHLILPGDGSGQLRLFDVSGNRILMQYPATTQLSSIPQSIAFPQGCNPASPAHSLRIEEIPVDELNLRSDETIVYVSHFDKELHEAFGVPFTVRIREGERYTDVRERIRRRLEVPEKEFERWRFVLMSPPDATYIPNENDAVVNVKLFQQSCPPDRRPFLGIEHKPSKRPRYAPNEKPIKIHN